MTNKLSDRVFLETLFGVHRAVLEALFDLHRTFLEIHFESNRGLIEVLFEILFETHRVLIQTLFDTHRVLLETLIITHRAILEALSWDFWTEVIVQVIKPQFFNILVKYILFSGPIYRNSQRQLQKSIFTTFDLFFLVVFEVIIKLPLKFDTQPFLAKNVKSIKSRGWWCPG